MSYTNQDIFIISSSGCMDTERDGVESILAGNEEGAGGCSLSVDLTADGLAVISSEGWCRATDGERMPLAEYSYAELHARCPQLVPAGQAIELADACRGKLVLTLRDPVLLPQLRTMLRHADYLDDTLFIGLGLVEAARLAMANPELHIIGELPAVPDEVDALVAAVQGTGLFGIRASVRDLTPALLHACRRAGLFTMSLPTDEFQQLEYLVHAGVNFIETPRPDLGAALLPDEAQITPATPPRTAFNI